MYLETSHHNSITLDGERYGRHALEDIATLQGDEPADRITHGRFPGERHHREYVSSDQSVIAKRSRGRRMATVVSFTKLLQGPQAARWTALQAYRTSSGEQLTELALAVPNLRHIKEYMAAQELVSKPTGTILEMDARDTQRVNGAVAESKGLTLAEYKKAVQETRDRSRRDVGENAFQSEQDFRVTTGWIHGSYDMSRDYLEQASIEAEHGEDDVRLVLDRVPVVLPLLGIPGYDYYPSVTAMSSVLVAQGDSFPDAVHTMAQNYGDMASQRDQDPGATVAQALGASSMDQLDTAWNIAQYRGLNPLDAGQIVLGGLVGFPSAE